MIAAKRLSKEQIRSAAAQRKSDRLDFVQQMLRELRDMTEAEGEQFITHLIGMSYMATCDVIRERYDTHKRTENPRVGGSIPPLGTINKLKREIISTG